MATMNDCEVCDGYVENQELKGKVNALLVQVDELETEIRDMRMHWQNAEWPDCANRELREENRKLKIHIKDLVHEFVDDQQVFMTELSPSENLKQLVAEYIESTKRCKELEASFERLDAIINKRK